MTSKHARGMLVCASLALSSLALARTGLAQSPTPVSYRVPAQIQDEATLLPPDAVKLEGYLGKRVAANAKNRLVRVDDEPLLRGFRQKPGEHPWIGEHVGKWMHASTLAWVNTGDPALRAKLDRVTAELVKAQEPDGYLGTYVPEKRFGLYPGADWDVWSHKYNLIGLLTYHQYTGNPATLEAGRKMGDLLIHTFGPGKKSILAAGTHVGMASTSVLEPMVQLYRLTGEPRYLDFCKYIVQAWDEPKGPRVMTTLLTEKSVQKTANGKAYEMLSNLVGLCELARVTGDRRYLDTAVIGWEDVVRNQLYLTGSASHHEHFHAPHELPNDPGSNVGETCVTVTWIQLNSQLLRLTGQARYGNELERSYYNHLSAAQRPDGAQWCYYTALEGRKPYGPGINCCVSSGPRGMALAPQIAYFRYRNQGADGLAVNLFETSTVTTELGGQEVTLKQNSVFPYSGTSTLTVSVPKPARFALRVRIPTWAQPLSVQVGSGKRETPAPVGPDGGWAELPARRWKDGDRIQISFTLTPRELTGEHTNQGRTALTWGPIVLAYDEKRNPGLPSIHSVGVPAATGLKLTADPGEPLEFSGSLRVTEETAPKPATFVPFAEAGATGGRYQVWLRGPGTPLFRNDSLLSRGQEERSREGNVGGSILDGETDTFVVTFSAQPREEDWFAAVLEQPVEVRRIVYAHGKTFHDGGWFDASAGKPRIQAQTEKGGPWMDLGVLETYPATTATDSKGLKDGQAFTLRLSQPARVHALRVIGRPATGDNPAQAFASCAELQAFPE